MTFWGTLRTGEQMLLGEPVQAALSHDRDAPADLLRAVFPADRMWEELGEVLLLEQGKTLFRGIVDEQNTRLSSGGLSVELVCRSLEALLLDNEAMPETLRTPSLRLLEKKLLEPLGLFLADGDPDKKSGGLTVEKGESCWAVLERFCREQTGAAPWVDGGGGVHCGQAEETLLELKEVLSAEVSLLPCRRIGEVWQQSYRGGYDTPYRAAEAGTLRRRYASMQGGKSPRQILEEGERESFLLTVTCAGAWRPARNARACVTLPGAGRFEGCPVKSAAYLRGGAGERTRLVLERGKKPCG